MERLLSSLIVLALASTAAVASAGGAPALDPATMVLRKDDLPPGFVVDQMLTKPTPNSLYARPAWLRRLVRRSGRIRGYVRVYDKKQATRTTTVYSAADVYRTSAGAQFWVEWHDARERKFNARRKRLGATNIHERRRASVGADGWVYWHWNPAFTHVFWREGRVFATILAWGVGRDDALQLAVRQQRRIRSALR